MQQNVTTCKPGCDCPACTGLQCFDRPRFFTGQLLTESELNSMQEYGIAKQKLHNRYLHGCGIVCGLEVTCHDCDSELVTVHPGLALDCCGNEIVVCDSVDFNVIKAIAQCRKVEKRDCDPWRTPVSRNCDDIEQEWCITIRYREQVGKPTTALVSQAGNRCGCGSRGKGCTCGGSGGSGSGSATTTTTRSAQTCEPQRIIESFELGVVCLPGPGSGDEGGFFQAIVETLDKLGIHLPLECLVKCFTDLTAFAQEGIAIYNLLNASNAFANRLEIERRFCRLLESIRTYLKNETLTGCDLIEQLSAITCPSAPSTPDGMPTFVEQMTQALIGVVELLVNVFINCLCYEILPKCPPDVCDDRLMLACVTVRDGRVIRVCHEPRQYVLTAHNAVPAVLSVLLRDLCCRAFDFRYRGEGLANAAFRNATTAASFMGASYNSPLAAVAANVLRGTAFGSSLSGLASSMAAHGLVHHEDEGGAAIPPSGLIGLDVGVAREQLGDVETSVEHANWSPAEAFVRNLATPAVRTDGPVRLFVDDQNAVVGVSQPVEAERLRLDLDEANLRIGRLEEQIASLLSKKQK
jgi:hypothetical protein